MAGTTEVDENMMAIEATSCVDGNHSLGSQPLDRPGAPRREQECNFTVELMLCNFVMGYSPKKREPGCFKAAVDLKSKHFFFSRDEKQVSRVHTRVMYTSGRPLKHFKHLGELLWVIRDVVKGHKQSYYNCRMLHADVSAESTIIMPLEGETSGRLIDFDDATKMVDSWRTIEAHNDDNSSEVGRLKQAIPILLPSAHVEVVDELIKRFQVEGVIGAMRYMGDVLEFRAAYFDLDKDREIKLGDIGWHHQINNPPDFSEHKPAEGHRIGTLPFMSAEILRERPMFVFPTQDIYHDAIHDIESLFWVVTFICLVRAGPGMNMSRRELILNNEPENKELQNIVYRYFNSRPYTISEAKLCTSGKKMNNDILLKFHPYFKPLREMMNQWWQTLLIAYQYRKFEYYTIHDQILDILDEAIETLPEGQDRGTGDETRRREARELEKEPSFGTSGNHESGLDLSPERPIGVPVLSVSNTRLHQEPESPCPRRKKQKTN